MKYCFIYCRCVFEEKKQVTILTLCGFPSTQMVTFEVFPVNELCIRKRHNNLFSLVLIIILENIFSNYWMRLSRIWRILHIYVGTASVDNTLPNLQNVSYLRKPNSIITFLFIQNNYVSVHKGVLPFCSFFFLLTKNNGQRSSRFDNLQRAALLMSFSRHWLNMTKLLTSLVQYDNESSFQIWSAEAGYGELCMWF